MKPDPDAADMWVRLGLTPTASDAQIKAAYRGLARKYHPDHNQDPAAADRFHRISEAYTYVTDPDNEAGRRGVTARESSVTDETVMVLLAETRVGTVSEHFSAVGSATLPTVVGSKAPGLVCVGERGLAFVYRLSRAELKRQADRAVFPILFDDVDTFEIGAVHSDDPSDADPVSGLGVARLTTTDGRSLEIRATDVNLEKLRTVQVRYRADSVTMPSAPRVSFWTRLRGLRLRAKASSPRRKFVKSTPGSRLPLTNGWWLVGAGLVAVLIVGAALLVA